MNPIIAITILLTLCASPSYARRRTRHVRKKMEATQRIPHTPYTMRSPPGWQCISDPEALPKKVRLLFIGQTDATFTPSINLATEETDLSLAQYVDLAKNYHEQQAETECSLLGTINTRLGQAEVIQIDRDSQWGPVRFMQAALIHDGTAYVITATSLKDEFGPLSSQFLQAIKSFEIHPLNK